MYEPTQYYYSLKFSIGSIVLIILLMLLVLTNVIAANNTLAWVIYGFFVLVFLFMVTMLFTKRLMPALKGDVALEIDEEGINDYIRDVSIGWEDITEISLIRGRNASTLRIGLKWESDYGKQVTIPLRWVKGNDDEIYETIMAYFEHASKVL